MKIKSFMTYGLGIGLLASLGFAEGTSLPLIDGEEDESHGHKPMTYQEKLETRARYGYVEPAGQLEYKQTLYPSGNVMENIAMRNGERYGNTNGYFDNGKLKSETNYTKGLKDGYHRLYHANGLRRLGVGYIKGLKEGFEYHYDEKGELTHKVLYKNGIKVEEPKASK